MANVMIEHKSVSNGLATLTSHNIPLWIHIRFSNATDSCKVRSLSNTELAVRLSRQA